MAQVTDEQLEFDLDRRQAHGRKHAPPLERISVGRLQRGIATPKSVTSEMHEHMRWVTAPYGRERGAPLRDPKWGRSATHKR